MGKFTLEGGEKSESDVQVGIQAHNGIFQETSAPKKPFSSSEH